MKFPYQEYPRQPSDAFPDTKVRIIPIIPVTLVGPQKSITVDALVDSGAENCIFPGMLGLALGLDVNRAPKQLLSGLGGRVVEARFHHIELKVGKETIKAYAGFSFDTIGITGLLGQRGFFDSFRVVFDRPANSVIVNRINPIQKILSALGV